ncbi:MAG: double-strand break repair helicase AddA, partial [Paracoccaceae bacterium]
QKAGQRLSAMESFGWEALPVLEAVFLTGKGAKEPFLAKLGSFPTKPVQAKLPELMPQLGDWMLRVESARESRLALTAARKTFALHAFANQFLPTYEMRKQQRGWLDFDDLIHKARHLLNDPAVAQWVLYRLDGGIDHILVDEAQDTSPAQWDVIKKLAQEFTSGQGARADKTRAIFVVGDKKQSIYSFQGADPREFDRMKQEFKTRLDAVNQPLLDLTLDYSFRSSNAILRLVDLTFEEHLNAGFSGDAKHLAFKLDMPGRVDLWPVVDKVEDPDDRDWYDPVDRRGAHHHTVILANQIARNIRDMIVGSETVPVDGPTENTFRKRAVRAGDFLILLQRRNELFHEIIRACKGENLSIAGADRLKVGAETAVKDLGALLAFLSTPEDNLALATALKSPLFGWSEQDLFSLSHHRSGPYLWQALREESAAYPETLAILNDLRGQTDFLRPFDLIERILTRHKGRKSLLARLGLEAEDGINALLSQALAYERSAVPSLTGFLIWMQTDDLDIKRQMDSAGDQIRVMTVHGAKGLEAPIVILPDTGKRDVRLMDEVIETDGNALWRTSVDASPAAIATAREAQKQAQINERLRLLYVAMTRAEKWLIVAAAGDLSKDASSWYQLIQAGMNRAGAVVHDFEGGDGLRYSEGDWAKLETVLETPVVVDQPTLMSFPDRPVTSIPPTQKTISPSDLGGPKALSGEAGTDEEAAKRRGRQIHLLLEHLPGGPESDWPIRATQILSQGADFASDVEVTELLDEARRVLINPNLTELFTSDTLAEVSVTADFGDHRVHGTIDRLIIRPAEILAVDFKSNAIVPHNPEATPEGVLRQMGAYAHALAQVYPTHTITTAIVWTRTGMMMHLPHDIVTDAVNRAPYLDGGPNGS